MLRRDCCPSVLRQLLRTAVAILVCCSLAGGPGRASEPAGAVHFDYEWPEVSEPAATRSLLQGERALRLTLAAAIPLDGAVLQPVLPEGVSLRRLPGPGESDSGAAGGEAQEGGGGLRIELGRLRTSQPVRLDFAVIVEDDRWGIAEFLLEAHRSDGRSVREAVGVPVGEPPRGVLRDGAIEFPAAVADPARR